MGAGEKREAGAHYSVNPQPPASFRFEKTRQIPVRVIPALPGEEGPGVGALRRGGLAVQPLLGIAEKLGNRHLRVEDNSLFSVPADLCSINARSD